MHLPFISYECFVLFTTISCIQVFRIFIILKKAIKF